MMAGDMDSVSGVGSKRRIAETLLQPPELSNSVFPVGTQDDSSEKISSLASSSSSIEAREVIQDLPSPTKKVKCFLTEENNQKISGSIDENKVGSGDLASGSFDCGTKIGDFGEQMQDSEDSVHSVVDSVSGDEQKKVEIEEIVPVNDVKAKNGKEIVRIEVRKGSDIEEKKGVFREAENVLEAKKKQLLAKFDAGVFKDNNALGFDPAEGILCNLKGIDESVRRSLKVEVIDDTALIDTLPFPKNGNGCVKVAERNGKKNVKQEADGKKPKRPRRKGKDGRKDLDKMPLVGNGLNGMVRMGQKNGNNTKWKYTREEMEALRFGNIVEQRNLWRAVYAGLGDAGKKEYNELAISRNQKNFHNNCDPSQRVGRKGNAILGKAGSGNGDAEISMAEENEVENIKLLDSGCCLGTQDEDANSIVEEECNDEDDSDEEYASIQRPAFHVEGEPNFDSGPPEDGFEYLRRVRWEATHVPKFKVAKLDKSKFNKEQSVYMLQFPEIEKCPEHLLPLKQWEDAFLADFSELRKILSYDEDCSIKISSKMQSFSIVDEQNTFSHQLAESTILEKFNNLGTNEVRSDELLDGSCIDNTSDQLANTEGSDTLADPQNTRPSSVADSSCNYPRLSAILAMDAVARVSMLRKRINLAETASTLSKDDCVWLFALCAAVDTPLDADTTAALRSLFCKCASLRAAKSELDDEVIMLNILATISGKYFGQSWS